ncbi:acyl-CoA thioesterase domain-containing protein [Nocardia sp. CA-151230]|uniref:acyl-CoA thioesterase domain-containing protein n=1 Tax=Nocardia sp. CA-151230 TaxID=3239982 RepID=UPI003D8BDC40
MANAVELATGFFESIDGGFAALEAARGPWRPDSIGGQALTALAARELEQHCPIESTGCRLTLDFIRPTTFDAIQTRTELIRSSTRLALLHLDLVQSDHVVVRASALFVRPLKADQADGNAWTPAPDFSRPGIVADPATPTTSASMISSAGYPDDWSADFADHRNNARKRMWTTTMIPAIAGEEATPFTRVATLAEATSLVTNWSEDGVPFINADVTVNLCRMPESEGVGLESNGQHAAAGVAVGSATLYDEFGVLGVSSVTAVANTHRQVRF